MVPPLIAGANDTPAHRPVPAAQLFATRVGREAGICFLNYNEHSHSLSYYLLYTPFPPMYVATTLVLRISLAGTCMMS